MRGPGERGIELDLSTRHHDILVILEQGEVERAADLCRQLLADYPRDVAVHVLMGDIFAARGAWDAADEWYEAAQDLGGHGEVDERRVTARAMLARRAPAPVVAEPSGEDLQRRTIAVRSIFIAAGAVAGLALVIALIAVFSRPSGLAGGRPTQPTPEPVTSRPGAVVAGSHALATPAVPGQPPAGLTPGSHAVGATGGTTHGPGPGIHAPVIITRLMTVPATDEDYIIAQAVSALTWPNGESMSGDVSVMMDPYQGYGMVSFRLPDTLPGNHLYDTVVMQAYQVVLAVLAADANVQGLTVRVLYTLEIKEAKGHRDQTVQAFRVNTTRDAVKNYVGHYTVTPASLVQYLFAAPWWNPAVPPGQ